MSRRIPIAAILTITIGITVAHCGTNVLEFASVDTDSSSHTLEQAKKLLDERDYPAARKVLESSKKDSNERRALLVSARLGESGLDIWQIIKDLLSGSTSGVGIDGFFNVLTSSVFGVGDVRASRITAMRQSLADLASAPNPSDNSISDVACFVAALWTVPLVSDAQSSLNTMQSALSSVTPSDCSGLDGVDSSLATISTLSSDFKSILGAINGCGFVNLSSTANSLNAVEKQLTKLTTNADAGCPESPQCSPGDTACQALQLSCVHEKLNEDGTSVAGDGIVATCELVHGCLDPSNCFTL